MFWKRVFIFLVLCTYSQASVQRRAYVNLHYAGQIAVIDIVNNTLLYTVPLPGTGPNEAIAVTPDGNKVYSGCTSGGGVIVQMDTSTNQVSTVLTGIVSYGIAITDKGIAYITDYNNNKVFVLDTKNNEIITVIYSELFSNPDEIYIPKGGSIAYVVNVSPEAHSLVQIDLITNQVINNPIVVTPNPEAVVVTSNNQKAYVACSDANQIDYVDLANQTSTSLPYSFPQIYDLAITPDNKTVYAPSRGTSPSVTILYGISTNTNTITSSVLIPRSTSTINFPYVALNGVGSRSYVTSGESSLGYVTVVDNLNSSVIAEIPITVGNFGVRGICVYDPDLTENLVKAYKYDPLKVQKGISN